MARNSIEAGEIAGRRSIMHIFEFLIRKSNDGDDRNLQLFISRTLSSLCARPGEERPLGLLQNVVGLVMPVLLSEVERGGNYTIRLRHDLQHREIGHRVGEHRTYRFLRGHPGALEIQLPGDIRYRFRLVGHRELEPPGEHPHVDEAHRDTTRR